MYNAFGGGDLLYGIEPMTYYLKNLILNLTFLLPLAILQLILIYPISKILFKKQILISSSSSTTTTIQELNPMINDKKKKEIGRDKLRFFVFHICFSISPFLWFVVMMSRPHKVFLLVCFVMCFFVINLGMAIGGEVFVSDLPFDSNLLFHHLGIAHQFS